MKPFVTKFCTIGVDLTPAPRWQERACNPEIFEEWDYAQRRKRGWRAGLTIWQRTNVRGVWTLISRHWPHKLCWDWSVSVTLKDPGVPRRLIFVIAMPHHHAEINLFGPGIRISWQNYGYMIATDQRQTHDAPVIFWKRRRKADGSIQTCANEDA